MICKNCKYYYDKSRICRNMKARYVGCEECYNANPKPTNADRIRALNDKKLANYIWQLQNTKERRSTNDWLDWLKQEVDYGD